MSNRMSRTAAERVRDINGTRPSWPDWLHGAN